MTLTEIRRAAQSGPVSARVQVQVESATPKLTREQKPYCELNLADACDRMTLRVWSDHPAYKACSALNNDSFVELNGEFSSHSQYGLEAQKWTVRPLTEQEKTNYCKGRPNCARNKPPTGNSFSKRSGKSRIRGCARYATRLSRIWVNAFGAPRRHEKIITLAAAVWLNTRRK